jgi:site-specific DNA-methyltransferase (adenine-specific)
LKKGKKAYQNVSNMVEKLLDNIEYVPVQRNSGIDAILKRTYKDSPILIRIQKEDETIEEAIKSLNKAVVTKQSKKSFLIRTNDVKSLFEHDNENSNIEIINSTIYEINKLLNREI